MKVNFAGNRFTIVEVSPGYWKAIPDNPTWAIEWCNRMLANTPPKDAKPPVPARGAKYAVNREEA